MPPIGKLRERDAKRSRERAKEAARMRAKLFAAPPRAARYDTTPRICECDRDYADGDGRGVKCGRAMRPSGGRPTLTLNEPLG